MHIIWRAGDKNRVETSALQGHNINISRGLLGRWLNYSKTVSNSSCSVQKMMNILRTALEPMLDPEEPEPRLMESQTVEIFPVAPVKKDRRQERDLDMKMRSTARLKQALYQSIKQHAGW